MNINQAAKRLAAAIKAEHDRSVEFVPPGWFTIQQLSAAIKQHMRTVQRKINPLVASGKWQERKFRIKTGDKVYPVPHFKEK